MESIPKYLKKNFLVSVSKILTVSLVTLLLLPLIIKKIGLDLYGIVSLTLLFSGVSSLIDLGLSKAVILLSGEKKISENQVVSSALFINMVLISILSVVFIALQLFSVDILGSELNINETDKFIVLNTGFLLLVLMLLNNLCRAILEANYLMHIVNLSLAIYTPLLYTAIFVLSFFTDKVIAFILTPLFITLLMLIFNVVYIKRKTAIHIVRIGSGHLKYVLKSSLGFLNIGLVNSMVMPSMRYIFVLMVADVGLYALFDLSFKIAMLANSFIISLSTPMFAVFSKQIKTKAKGMVKVAFNIFYISIAMYLLMVAAYYFLGGQVLSFLDLEKNNLNLLYNITLVLILSLGSVAIVEIFYRYFLGDNQLKKAFLMKLIVPICGIIFFFVFSEFDLVYRFIYAYGLSLFISALVIFWVFFVENRNKQVVEI